jgi:hypothetical protein
LVTTAFLVRSPLTARARLNGSGSIDRFVAGQGPGIRALLAHAESEDVAFEPPRLGDDPLQLPDLG